MIRVKICGITRVEDALVAAEAGADGVGFILYKDSKRYIDPADAGVIVRELPPFVTTVGVFVNATEEEILAAVKASNCSTIQLHGDETPGFANVFSRKVIKAFRLASEDEIDELDKFPSGEYLLDTPGESYGGTGRTGDWDLAAKVARKRRIILAGGLTPDNVADAIRTVRPYAVDVAGGVEKSPGIKDHDKVRAFIHNARTAL